MFVDPWCAVGVGVVGFALQHDGGLVPAAAWHVAGFASADDLSQVFLATEQHLDVFMQTTSSVEAGIDDDAVAVVVLAQDVRIDGTEAIVVHGLDVYVSQASVGPFLHILGTLFYPPVVEQSVELSVADGLDDLIPALSVVRVVEGEEGLLAGQSVEQRGEVRVTVDFRSVDFF